MPDYPIRVKLGHCLGDSHDDHAFWIRVEGPSETLALMDREDVLQPWLRPCCSCGWIGDDVDRFTIEENAHWAWQRHLEHRNG